MMSIQPKDVPHQSSPSNDDEVAYEPLDMWAQPRAVDGSYIAIDRESLPALTSLRFFAAAVVLVHHLVNMALLYSHGADANRQSTWYLSLATQGHVGVTFFFVLSGFILAWCYHTTFAKTTQRKVTESRTKFWFARFARVWPLHAAMFFLFVPITLLDSLSVSGLVKMAWTAPLNLLLLQSWIPFGGPDGIADTFNAPSWTLSCEAFFYALFPLMATIFVAKLRWGIAQLAIFATACWGALGTIAMLASDADKGLWFVTKFPAVRIADFAIGVCLGLIVVQLRQRHVTKNNAQQAAKLRERTSSTWTIIEAVSLVLCVAAPLFLAIAGRDALPETLSISWLHLPAFSLLIVVMAIQRGAFSQRLFAQKHLLWLGEASYALYLTHMLILLTAYHAGLYAKLGVWSTSVAVFVTAVIVSGIVHEYFEKPVRSKLVGWYARRAVSK